MVATLVILSLSALILLIWAASKGGQQSASPHQWAGDSQLQARRTNALPKPPTITWIPANQDFTMAGFTIPHGLVYTGQMNQTDSWTPALDPSMIDLDLEVKRPPIDFSLPSLGYWPTYQRLTPECRGTYLAWLAGGRIDPSIDIGYVFLFFYGLERRLLVDAQKSEQAKGEAKGIITELERLLKLFGGNSSLRNYAANLIEISKYLYAPESIDSGPPEVITKGEFPLSLKLALSDFAVKEKPISPEWAMSWLDHSLEYYPRTPAIRCKAHFEKLFKLRYRGEFGEGMVLKANKTPLKFEYRPASSAFRSPVVLESADVPDITVLKGPVTKLMKLADSCADDLDAYSRYLYKDPAPGLSPLGLLPHELVNECQTHEFLSLKAWLGTSVSNTEWTVVESKELLTHFSFEGGSTLPKICALSYVQLLAKLGYGIEPDPRFDSVSIDPNGKCVLFKVEGPTHSCATEEYRAATLTAHLAATVIAADGDVSLKEEQLLLGHIDSVLGLSASENQRLRGYLQWLKLANPNFAGLKRRLAAWSMPQRQSVARLLLILAGADNRIDPAEITILKKIYKLLELDPDTLYSDLHAVQTQPEESPTTILHANPEPEGRHIPKPRSRTKRHEPSTVRLDAMAIQQKLRESRQVQQMLAEVFAGDPIEERSKLAALPSTTQTVLGLDVTHSALVERLLSRLEWSRDDVEALCSEYQVLPDGAIELINTAAIERHGEVLFDYSDSLQVNIDIAKEINP